MTPEQVTNAEFLGVALRNAGPGEFGWVTSFKGDPKNPDEVGNKDWRGRSFKPGSPLVLNETGNTFFNLSTVKEDAGLVARTEAHFVAVHVVMADDIETKSTLPDGVVPSALIETSPGNFQAHFFLSTPERDLQKCKALFKALAAKGFTDAGAQGPQSRYARLPVGVNHKGKCGPGGFAHRLAKWNAELTFTIDEIASMFGLQLVIEEAANDAPMVNTRPATKQTTATADAIIIAKVHQSAKGRRAWDGDDGGADGSAIDQYLLNSIAFKTEDAEQVERIYGLSPRADRKSKDGTLKWRARADYRKLSIDKAFQWVEAHPRGDADEARATVETAIATAKAGDDFRIILAPEVVEAWTVLEKGDPANHAFFRQQARKAGVPLATLDAEVNRASDAQNLSHDEAAELAISKLGGSGSILSKRGTFWHWRQERGVWKCIDSDEAIKQVIHSVLPRQQINAGTVGSILSVLRTKVSREDVVFDGPRPGVFINCVSGTLYLKDDDYFKHGCLESWWELRSHRREDFLTTLVPVVWQEGTQCPRFERFLDHVTERDSDGEPKRQLLVEAMGYTLTHLTSEERFFVLYGETSNNGKSTFLKVLQYLLGKENVAALNLQQLGERFGLAGLEGKLANLCAEVARGAVLPDDAIKKLTSGDTITVERKGKDHHEINPFATLWFATNALPNLRDLSPATLEKRCVLIEFNRSFKGEDRDTRLIERLQAELPGIFWMCVETFGARLALARTPSTWTTVGGALEPISYFDCLLEDPPSSVRAKAAWRKDSDPVQQFADECLVQGSDKYVAASELYAAWLAWAEAHGVRLSLSSRVLTGRLGKMFPQIATGDEARQGRTRGVRGLGLANVTA